MHFSTQARFSVCCLLLLLVLIACGQPQHLEGVNEGSRRPNFLIIMTDDMGYTDLGAFGGNDIATPNLDRLAMNGIRFSNFHGHLSCAPSRAMLMSGTGNHEAGLGTQTDIERFRGERNYERYLVDRVATLPEILRDAGYRTYIAGKWGLGGPLALDPSDRGFAKSFALVPSGGGHFQAIFHQSRYSYNGKEVPEPEQPTFSTTLFIDQLVSFFEEDKNSDAPFFALFTPTAPHWPLHFPPAMKPSFDGHYASGYEQLRAQRLAGAMQSGVLPEADVQVYQAKAAAWNTLDEDEKALQAQVMEIYAAMVAHLDQEIGRLLNNLQALGALENTLILFINDNGAQGGPVFGGPRSYSEGRSFDNRLENLGEGSSWVNMGQGWADAVNAPFRDGKGTVYEGSVRVAAFANWPGIKQPASVYRQYLNNMDVLPSLLELAGIAHPAPRFNGRDVLPARGKSFARVLRGDASPVHPDDEAITLSSAGRHFMQRGSWKLLKELNADWELYNLADDPYERRNLAATQPAKLDQMLTEFRLHAKRNNILDR